MFAEELRASSTVRPFAWHPRTSRTQYVQLIVLRHRGDRRRAAEELQLSLATLKRTRIERQRSV